jgi:MoaA/NifB/PqqE/SkfB family radical SAM enzyme
MDKLIKDQSMCLLPWNAAAIKPSGIAMPCSRFNIPEADSFSKESNVHLDFRNSTKWVETRKMMLLGEKIPSCFRCYREEDSGAESMRTISLKKHIDQDLSKIDIKTLPLLPIPIDHTVLPLTFLEISFSNLCNLACVSCNQVYSSTWAAEDYKNGRPLKNQKALIEHNSDLSHIDLSSISLLKIIGGEPFMDQKRFISLLDKLDLQNLKLIISTNGTILPNHELKVLIDQCKQVIISVSLDGIGTVNEWYRWPTKFLDVISTMDQFHQWWNDDPRFLLEVHSVINVYNIWTLDETVLFMNDRFPSWGIDFDWIITPKWQRLSIIPMVLKQSLYKQLTLWHETIKPNVRFGKSNPFKVSIDRLNDVSDSSLDEFKSFSLLLAKERNLNLFKMVPHVEKIINF